MKETNGGISVKVTGTGFRLRTIDFVDIITVFSVVGDQDQIDGEAFRAFEHRLGELVGEGVIDEFLKAGVFGQGFEDGGGDGVIVGRTGEIAASGEDGLDAAKCAKQDVDEDWVVTFGAVILFLEQIADGILKVVFDTLVTFGKIFP